MTQTAVLILAAAGITFGMVRAASAQAPAEYQGPKHDVGVSAAHLNRPHDPAFVAQFRDRAAAKVKLTKPELAEGSDAFDAAVAAELEPIVALSKRLMADLICTCGCKRETILECRCGFASGEREKVLAKLGDFDLLDPAARDRAYRKITDDFVAFHGGQHVLTVPRDEGFNRLAWVVPYAAFAGAFLLLIGLGRRWVRRGRATAHTLGTGVELAPPSDEDSDYADLLDDELADAD